MILFNLPSLKDWWFHLAEIKQVQTDTNENATAAAVARRWSKKKAPFVLNLRDLNLDNCYFAVFTLFL